MKHFLNVKSTVLVLIAVLSMAGSAPAIAQNKSSQNVTLNLKQVTVKDFFSELKKQTGLNFVYSSDLARTLPKVTVNAQNKSAKQVLDEVMGKINCQYDIDGNIVTVTKKNSGKNIAGVVIYQDDGEPVIGASVRVEGTDVATVTNKEGRFELNHTPKGAKVVVSYVGMDAKSVQASSNMIIRLKASLTALNDVVVMGYGKLLKKDVTGSVAVVKTEEIVNTPSVTLDDALVGKVAGMQVVKSDGSPGGAVRIRVRGGSSIQGGVDPLYIIDGIPTEITNNYLSSSEVVNPIEAQNYGEDFNNSVSGSFMRGLNSLAGLNINDIESITVLKDASATAIYGSKAANGVVIINTKRGSKDMKPRVNVNYALGISNPMKEKVCNGEQYLTALKSSLNTSIKNMEANGMQENRYYTTNKSLLAEVEGMKNANTDWVGAVLRTGISHNVDGSVSGGSANTRYYASVSYTNQEGTLINTDFNRYTGRISLDTDVSTRFRAGLNASLSYSRNNITNGVYGQALLAPPILSIYNEDGTYNDYTDLGLNSSYMGFQNPLALAQAVNRAKTYSANASVYGEYSILKDLKFKSTLSIAYNNYRQTNYVPSFIKVGGFYGTEDSNGGKGTEAQTTATNLFWENTLTYDHIFNEVHRLNAVIGHAWETDRSEYFSATGMGYPDDYYLNNLSSAMYANAVAGANPSATTALLSFYGRFNYTLMDRYIFTFTGRSDSSSKFSKAHRTGFFPSGAVAWRMNEEPFLRAATWIDELKLRGSIGKTGTQKIDNWMYLTLYSPTNYAGSSALVPSQLGNDDIRWESTLEKDVALDFSFLRSRIGGSIGYYHKVTDGALLSVTPAPSSGYSTVVSNIAKVKNIGVEVELFADIIRTKDWKWNLSFNLSHNSSTVLKIDGDMFSSSTDRKSLNLGTSVIQEGASLGQLCGYVAKGLITTQEQLEDYKSRFSMWTYMAPDLGIGSMEFDIDPETGYYYQDVIGNCTPDFFGGITSTLTWRNWSLLTGWTFSYGNDLIYQKDVTDKGFSSLTNRGTRVLDASTADNYNGNMINSYRNWYTLTNLNVYDASYLKLQTLSLAYNFGRTLLSKIGMNSLQLYVTASNVFTITKYPGPDPAVSDDPYSISGGGRDASTYPTVKSYTFGIRVGF